MAVALVGFVQEAWNMSGQATLTYPVGSAAGHLAIVEASHSDSSHAMPSGWVSAYPGLWWRVLTAADLTAGTVLVRADLTGMVVLSGAAGFGRKSESATVKVTKAAGAAFWRGWTSPYRSSLAAATYRIGTETTSARDQHKHGLYLRIASAIGYYTLDGTSSSADFVGWEILPPAAPLAPTLVGPATGAQLDRTAPIQLSVAHQSASGLPQEQIKLVIRPAGGTWVSVKSDGTLHTDTSIALTQTSGVVTIAANVLTANQQYEWTAYTADSSGWSPAPASRTFVARTPPTAAVTLTTTAEDLSPLVEWTTTPGTGSQTAYEVRICAAGDTTPDVPIVRTVGMVAGTDVSWTPAPSTDYINGADYAAWVRVADAALTGPWAASDAETVSWTPPTAPTSVTAAAGSPTMVTVAGIIAGADTLELEWSTDGVDYTPYATIYPDATTEVIPVVLHEFAGLRWFRARVTDVVDGVSLPSAWTATAASTTGTDRGAYLVDATDPTVYLAVSVRAAGGRTPLEGFTVSTGLGATRARVDRSPSAGWSGRTLLRVSTIAAETALVAWIMDRGQYWFRRNPERDDAGATYHDSPATLIARSGVAPVDRLAEVDIAHRVVELSWVTQ